MPDGNSIVFVMGSEKGLYAIYRLNLETQELSKVSGSDGMWASRGSPDGRYLIARNAYAWMLYDSKTNHWSEFADGSYGAPSWSHDSKFV